MVLILRRGPMGTEPLLVIPIWEGRRLLLIFVSRIWKAPLLPVVSIARLVLGLVVRLGVVLGLVVRLGVRLGVVLPLLGG